MFLALEKMKCMEEMSKNVCIELITLWYKNVYCTLFHMYMEDITLLLKGST